MFVKYQRELDAWLNGATIQYAETGSNVWVDVCKYNKNVCIDYLFWDGGKNDKFEIRISNPIQSDQKVLRFVNVLLRNNETKEFFVKTLQAEEFYTFCRDEKIKDVPELYEFIDVLTDSVEIYLSRYDAS